LNSVVTCHRELWDFFVTATYELRNSVFAVDRKKFKVARNAAASGRLRVRLHVLTQRGINAALITFAGRFEEVQDVSIQTQRNLLLILGRHQGARS
jgi:hypothetical protein